MLTACGRNGRLDSLHDYHANRGLERYAHTHPITVKEKPRRSA